MPDGIRPPPFGPRLAFWIGLGLTLLSAAFALVALPEPRRVASRWDPPPQPAAPRTMLLFFDGLNAAATRGMPAWRRLADAGVQGTSLGPAVSTTGPALRALFTGEPATLSDFRHNFRHRPRGHHLLSYARRGGRQVLLFGPTLSAGGHGSGADGAAAEDERSLAAARAAARGANFDLLAVLFYSADYAGHMAGPASEGYRRAAAFYDRALAELTAAAPAGTAVVALSDHGMDGEGFHTRDELAVRRPPFLLSGEPFAAGRRLELEHAAFAPLLAELIGVPIPARSLGALPHEAFAWDAARRAQALMRDMRQRSWLGGDRAAIAALGEAEASAHFGRPEEVPRIFAEFSRALEAAERARTARLGAPRKALAALLLTLGALVFLPAIGARARERPGTLLVVAGVAIFAACPAGLSALEGVSELFRGLPRLPRPASLAGLAALAFATRRALGPGHRASAALCAAWALAGTLLPAAPGQVVAPAFGAVLLLSAAAAALWLRRRPGGRERLALSGALLFALGAHQAAGWEALAFAAFVWSAALYRDRLSASPPGDAAWRPLAGLLALRAAVFFAAGNDLHGRFLDLQNPALLGGEAPLRLAAIAACVLVKLYLPDLVLGAALQDGLADGARAGEIWLGACAAYAAAFVALMPSALACAGGPAPFWGQLLPALTLLLALQGAQLTAFLLPPGPATTTTS